MTEHFSSRPPPILIQLRLLLTHVDTEEFPEVCILDILSDIEEE